jgi:hypothetical protein
LLRQEYERALSSPFRDEKVHLSPRLILKHPLNQSGVFHPERQENFLRKTAAAEIIQADGRGEQLFRFFFRWRVENLRVTPDEIPPYVTQNRQAAFHFAPEKPDHIGVGPRPGHHVLLFAQGFDRAQTVPQFGGALKAQLFRRLFHFTGQACAKLFIFALQDQHRLFHRSPVPFRVPGRQAIRVPKPHMAVQAGTVPPNVARKFPAAVRQFQRGADCIYDGTGLIPTPIRSEVAGRVSRRF